MRIGLEAITFAVPKFFIDMTDLANARGADPAKFIKGLGQVEMAVATPAEDTVVLAADAGMQLLKKFDIDPSSIGLLIVGTETSVDQSKPVSIYVHQLLGLSSACRAFEIKHACYGAMAGVTMATDWILSGRAKSRKALVIASDIARYGAGTPGEPTQGAGAVAMLISDQAQLLEFNTEKQGYYSKQVMDFWRPNYSKEAFADGHFSINCYLDALAASYEMYTEGKTDFATSLRACLYHAPFVKMAQKAHIKLLEVISTKKIEAGTPEYASASADYAKRVAPSLEINSRVGNIYTGSLFLSLLGFLSDAKPEDAGQVISLFSYGSGCVSEYMTGRLVDGTKKNLQPFREVLDSRTRISIAQYEEILAACGQADQNLAEGNFTGWGKGREFFYNGCKDNQRQYFANGKMVIP
jgi:hydroxymethylglutaryl-CoA synthase